MAHEIKNPLTPVRLAAERMRRKARGSTGCDPALAKVVEEGADTIVQEVRTLAALVDAFHRFARLPETSFGDCDLGSIVGQVVKLYDGTKAGVQDRGRHPGGPRRGEGRRAADQARGRQPRRQRRLGDPSRRGGADPGVGRRGAWPASSSPTTGRGSRPRSGISSSSRPSRRSPKGFGLGLSITSRIAAEHRGRVVLEENSPRGCRFVLEWPAA